MPVVVFISIFLVQTFWAPGAQAEAVGALSNEPISALPLGLRIDRIKADLGERLFSDPILSRDQTISCASCHILDQGGTDHRPYSIGINGAEGELNAPTVFNATFNFAQFWDGRVTSLEDQVDFPITSEIEMDSSWDLVLERLRYSVEYRKSFERAFEDSEINKTNVGLALAEYQKRLTTPGSRFDLFLSGQSSALNQEEEEGYALFKRYGCVSCHNGRNIGGNMFAKMGVVRDYFAERGEIHSHDYGRFNVTGREADRFVFKVPSLRNIELTAPYFHDGSAETLEDAVNQMARYQLGRRLPDEDLTKVVAFLKTLTGEHRQ